MTVEDLHHAREVQQRAAEPVYFVHHHAVHPAGGDVGQQELQRRTLHVGPGESAIVVCLLQQTPALRLLTADIRLGRFALGVE